MALASADLIIGCDPIVTAGKETLLRMVEGRTHVALNAQGTPTAAFVHNGAWQNPSAACAQVIEEAVGVAGLGSFNADAMATKLMGDTLFINPMVLGYAWQKGWVPLGEDALMRAMELNGVAVEQNKTAFAWGRRAAHDWPGVEKLLTPAQVIQITRRSGLDELIATRAEFLVGYQNAAYAERYKAFVQKVRDKEQALFAGAVAGVGATAAAKGRPEQGSPPSGGSAARAAASVGATTSLSEAVAKGLFKLMAYKDEYEVARLHTDAAFHAKIAGMFEGDYKLNYHLAPPLLAKKNDKGELQKQRFGPAMLIGFRLLARLKGLRGGVLDVFGRTEERRTERALIGEYQASIDEVLQSLSPANHASAVEIARIPEQIKGYGHVKERHLKTARANWTALMAAFRNPQAEKRAA